MAILAASSIAILVAAILWNRCSPMVALVLVAAGVGLAAGHGAETGQLMVDGVAKIAPVAAMFVFAILFFGVMTDAGVLAPIVAQVLRLVGENPVRIVMGTAFLGLLIHLDGSGAVCFLVVIPAMAPLYDRLHLDKRVLACVVSMAAGVNFLPWTGPTLRAASALGLPVLQIFRPMLPVQLVGLVFVFAAAGWLGAREARRLAVAAPAGPGGFPPVLMEPRPPSDVTAPDGPKLFWLNLGLIVAVMAILVSGLAQPAAVFMVGTSLALLLNFPSAKAQSGRVEAHARAALTMAGILLGAGAFMGVMSGVGALQALAHALVGTLPAGAGRHIPFGLSLIAMPLSMLFDPDSFYLGVLPVLAEMHHRLGGAPVQVAQAALVGQMTAGFPVSPLTPATFLVAGLSGLDLSTHQRFSFLWLYAASLVMALACVAFGVFST